MEYRVDDRSLSGETFLDFVQQVWPGAYNLEQTRAALSKTMNFTAWDGGQLAGCLRVLTDGCFFGTIPELLVRQVQSSVYLEDTIRRLAELGVDTVVEIGPGRTLSGFVRKTAKQIKCYPVETAEELEAAIAALKGA